ncbi:MAG: class I SAM-dependent methyltransferase [Rhodocyclaceae bacterium]
MDSGGHDTRLRPRSQNGNRPAGLESRLAPGSLVSTPIHPIPTEASAWVRRFAPLVRPGGSVLDLACGGGRHARFFAARGHAVEAVDRDAALVAALAGVTGVNATLADLEGGPWPYAGREFDAVVVTNYLHRPLFAPILDALAPRGVLLYETFMAGNERFGRPANPEYLLHPGELLERVAGRLSVIAFEQGEVERPKRCVVQRICAFAGAPPVRLPEP